MSAPATIQGVEPFILPDLIVDPRGFPMVFRVAPDLARFRGACLLERIVLPKLKLVKCPRCENDRMVCKTVGSHRRHECSCGYLAVWSSSSPGPTPTHPFAAGTRFTGSSLFRLRIPTGNHGEPSLWDWPYCAICKKTSCQLTHYKGWNHPDRPAFRLDNEYACLEFNARSGLDAWEKRDIKPDSSAQLLPSTVWNNGIKRYGPSKSHKEEADEQFKFHTAHFKYKKLTKKELDFLEGVTHQVVGPEHNMSAPNPKKEQRKLTLCEQIKARLAAGEQLSDFLTEEEMIETQQYIDDEKAEDSAERQRRRRFDMSMIDEEAFENATLKLYPGGKGNDGWHIFIKVSGLAPELIRIPVGKDATAQEIEDAIASLSLKRMTRQGIAYLKKIGKMRDSFSSGHMTLRGQARVRHIWEQVGRAFEDGFVTYSTFRDESEGVAHSELPVLVQW